MSGTLARVRRAAAATFAVHCVAGFVAALAITPLANAIDAALAASDHDHTSLFALATHVAGMHLTRELLAGASAALVFALVSPWFSIAWLCALDGSGSIADACARATERARTALATSGLVWLASGTCSVGIVGLAWTAHRALADASDVRLADLVALLIAAPLTWVALRALCIVDLVHAGLATSRLGALPALRGAWSAATPLVMLERFAAAWFGSSLPLVAWLASRALTQDLALGHTSTLVLGQCAALLSTFVRAAWLSRALEHWARHESRAAGS